MTCHHLHWEFLFLFDDSVTCIFPGWGIQLCLCLLRFSFLNFAGVCASDKRPQLRWVFVCTCKLTGIKGKSDEQMLFVPGNAFGWQTKLFSAFNSSFVSSHVSSNCVQASHTHTRTRRSTHFMLNFWGTSHLRAYFCMFMALIGFSSSLWSRI